MHSEILILIFQQYTIQNRVTQVLLLEFYFCHCYLYVWLRRHYHSSFFKCTISHCFDRCHVIYTDILFDESIQNILKTTQQQQQQQHYVITLFANTWKLFGSNNVAPD